MFSPSFFFSTCCYRLIGKDSKTYSLLFFLSSIYSLSLSLSLSLPHFFTLLLLFSFFFFSLLSLCPFHLVQCGFTDKSGGRVQTFRETLTHTDTQTHKQRVLPFSRCGLLLLIQAEITSVGITRRYD